MNEINEFISDMYCPVPLIPYISDICKCDESMYDNLDEIREQIASEYLVYGYIISLEVIE